MQWLTFLKTCWYRGIPYTVMMAVNKPFRFGMKKCLYLVLYLQNNESDFYVFKLQQLFIYNTIILYISFAGRLQFLSRRY